MKKKKIRLSSVYQAALLVLMYLPIAVVVVYSFNVSKNTTVWGGVTIDWYLKMFQNRGLLEALRNSIVLAALSSSAAGIIGTLGAVGMARVSFKSKGAVEYISTLPIMIPEIILGMVFMAFFAMLSLPFGMLTLVLGHTTFCVPYVFMMVKASLVGIDKSLGEAAKDLGASEPRAFWDITLPLITPAVVSGMLLAFAMSLDDVVISIFVTGAKTNTLPIRIYTQLKSGVTPEINALCSIMLVVTFVIVITSQIIGRRMDRGGAN
ncbi:putrescine ABC transporter permease PotI [Clostridium sp. chh4-2]|uniref:ABC transporter permease n=1 Tax=Clostridium sp. chh4-2 TaxID=2067550 RepID=UPI000CCEF18B|nr:ABC transporter permease [Clostridium sp. chh4-2]PNV62149.1 putrescine ABC transporter permease PotI [Clostridium sp. chh4-2]